MKRLLATLFLVCSLAAIAVGQGYIANHAIPIGQGPGVQGWGTGGPCAAGQGLTWASGAGADPTCGSVTTSPFSLLLGPSQIFVGSASSLATAVPLSGDCTIVTSGVITCLKTNNVAFGPLATQTTSLTNSQLLNSFTTVNAQTCTLGSSCTVPTNVSSPTTGSGNVVLQTSPYIVGATIASPTIVSAFTAPGLVTNTDLVNASTTVNGTVCTLGASCFFSTTASAIVVGTTAVQNATNPDVLYNNNGTLGQLPVTGTTSVVLAGSPTIVNPTITSAFNATGLVTNADLVNSTITLNAGTNTGYSTPGAMSLGGTYSFGSVNDTIQFTGLGLGGTPAPTTGLQIRSAPVTPGSNNLIAIGATTTSGGVIIGQGSVYDLTLENKNTTAVCANPTGTQTLSCNTLALTNALSVAQGGTGGATLTAHAALVGEGAANIGFATTGTGGNFLVDKGAGNDPAFVACGGDCTSITSVGVFTNGKINGVSYGATPGTNTVPVVTGSNTVTYEAVPNTALANASTTVNGQTCTLGSTCTIAVGTATPGQWWSIAGNVGGI